MLNFRIAPQHLKAGAYLVDAVVDEFELGGLVHDVLGAGDLTAVVQPGAQVELVALFLAHLEAAIGAVGFRAHAVGQHGGQLGHALAMAAGVGALGIDGVCHEPDHGVQQLLLRLDQLAGLDGHGQHARKLPRKLHKRRVMVGFIGCVHQNQQAFQLATAATQLQLHLLQAVRGGPGATAHRASLRVVKAVREGAAGLAVGGGPVHALRSAVPEVHRRRLRPCGLDQLLQHLGQHPLHMALGGHALAQAQEALDGGTHLIDHLGQFVDFAHHRWLGRGWRKIETPDAQTLCLQTVQRAAYAAAGTPAQRQEQQDDETNEHQQPLAAFDRIAQHVVHGRSHGQPQALSQAHLERNHHPQPFAPARIEGDGLAQAGLQCVERQQAGHTNVGQIPEAELIALAHQHTLHVRVGQHLAAGIEEGQLGLGCDAQLPQAGRNAVEHHVDTQHGRAVPRGLAQREPQFLRGEEDVGRRDADVLVAHGRLEPGAGAGVEAVFGLYPVGHQQPVAVHEPELSGAAAVGELGHRLDQIDRAVGRLEKCPRCGRPQRARQDEIAVGIPHIHRRHAGVGGQLFGEHKGAVQAPAQRFGDRDRVKGQLPQGVAGGLQRQPRPLGNEGARILGGANPEIHQPLAGAAPTQQHDDEGQRGHTQHHHSGNDHPDRYALEQPGAELETVAWIAGWRSRAHRCVLKSIGILPSDYTEQWPQRRKIPPSALGRWARRQVAA